MKPGRMKLLAREELAQYGLRLLAGRALSAAEVRTKLTKRAADPGDVDAVMDRLTEYGFLNDARFAEGFASARRESGAFGSQRVLRDLRQRKVGASLAGDAVQQAFGGTDETQLVREWLKRKLRSVNIAEYLGEEKHLASTYRKLRYAGFSSSAALKALREYSSRADEIEESPDEGPQEQ